MRKGRKELSINKNRKITREDSISSSEPCSRKLENRVEEKRKGLSRVKAIVKIDQTRKV